MSYNVSSVQIVHNYQFRISRQRLTKLKDQYGSEAPALSVFDFLDTQATLIPPFEERDGILYLRFFWWSSDGSGYTVDDLLVGKILPAFEGEADLVLIWEKGDSFTGLRLRDGVVTKHEVELRIGEEKK